MIRRGNVKIALQSIKSAKWRSLLTMLGIIIGVVSVVTTVSLGEGVKQQIRHQISKRGSDLITIWPGQRAERDANGQLRDFNPLLSDGSIFSDADYKTVLALKQLDQVVPFARVTGLAETDSSSYNAKIIATSGHLPDVLNQKIQYGSFFAEKELNKDFAVIGPRVAERLFKENIPMGKSFRVRGQEFIVRGQFEEFEAGSPSLLDEDYNNAIFIPYEVGQEITDGNMHIQQILAKPKPGVSPDEAVAVITKALKSAHGGQEDFTVLKQEETLALAGNVLNLLTGLIAGVAAISLIVGGIGIMNIMLVAVTERTGEIGVRKAIGATNHQILGQFLTEAVILSLVGGLIGVLLSIIINVVLRILTDLKPVITFPVMGIAVLVAVVVGIVFGVTPALRAARKDPIEALRYE